MVRFKVSVTEQLIVMVEFCARPVSEYESPDFVDEGPPTICHVEDLTCISSEVFTVNKALSVLSLGETST